MLIGLQNGHKGFLRDINLTDGLHPLLTTLLLFQQLGTPVGVPGVDPRGNILPVGLDVGPSDDLGTNGCLDRNLEVLPWNDLLQLRGDVPATLSRKVLVSDEAKSIDLIPVQQDIDFNQVA